MEDIRGDGPVYTGKGYIARIKEVDEFSGIDRLYAIVYDGGDGINYNTFKSICSVHNSHFFYSQMVNRDKPNGKKDKNGKKEKILTFTMEDCLNSMNNFPMVGEDGFYLVTHPITFKQFGHIAYDYGILTSQSGRDVLGEKSENCYFDVPDNEQPGIEQSGIEQSGIELPETEGFQDALQVAMVRAKSLMHSSDSSASDEVLNLRHRCELAEARAESLESLVNDMDSLIKELKRKLADAQLDNQNLMMAADTANAKLREFRASGALEVVSGLKPELALLKDNNDKLTSLVSLSKVKQTPDGVVDGQSVATLAESVKTYNDNMTNNFKNLLNALNVKSIPFMTPRGVSQERERTTAKTEGKSMGFSSVPVWSVSQNNLSGHAPTETNHLHGISSLTYNKGTKTDYEYGGRTPAGDQKHGSSTVERKRRMCTEVRRGEGGNSKRSNIGGEVRDLGSARRDLFGANVSGGRLDSEHRQGRSDTRGLSGCRNIQIPVWAKKPHNL